MKENLTSRIRGLGLLQRAIVFIGVLALAGVMVYPKMERVYFMWLSDGTKYEISRHNVRMFVLDANYAGMPVWAKQEGLRYYPEVQQELGNYNWAHTYVDRVDSILILNLLMEMAGIILFAAGLFWVVTPRRESLVPDNPVSAVRRFESDDPHRFPA
jgi:hypothetical protein